MEKLNSAKEAVSKMMFYYNQALVQSGCPDVKRAMATELSKMINLSSDQTKYVMDNVEVMSIIDMLKNTIVIVDATYDVSHNEQVENLDIITKSLESITTKLKENMEK